MNNVAHPEFAATALAHLRESDALMRELIDRIGPFTLRLHRDRFDTLVGSIISQQISWKAARSIKLRLNELIDGRMTPEALAAHSPETLRTAGLSGQKANYLLDLATKVRDKQVRLTRLSRMTDDEVIAELTQVKGIGVWTAQMFLIFALGRPDIFPHDDLGIRSAIRRLHQLEELPGKVQSHELAAPWRPYASVAVWYLWRSVDGDARLPDKKKPVS